MILDFLFQLWRRLSSSLQWRLLWWVNSKFMLTVACVVQDKQGDILLQRHRHWVQDVWGLPGGIVKSGETLEQAIAREVQEETGLVLEDIRLVHLASGYRLRAEVYFCARLAADSPRQISLQESEVLEARFFSPQDLPINLLPLQRQVITQVITKQE